MNKKIKKHVHKNLKWVAPLVALLIVGGFVFVLGMRKEQPMVSPEASHPASNRLDLSALPALASDVNLYNKNNLISIDSGYAEITHSDGREVGVTTQGDIVAGDRIRVSDDGAAEILWFDGSVTRLSADTDIRVLQASYDASNINRTKIDLWADRGKIWAKVIGLIEGESEFQIKSTNAIAGVRGTAFNYILENALPTIEVVEGVVSLERPARAPSEEARINITSGQTGSMKEGGTIEIGSFDPNKLNEPYYRKNIEEDRLANQKFLETNLEKIKQWAEPLPGSPGYSQKELLIQKALSQAKDPMQLEVLKTRAAKIKMAESIALSDQSDAETTIKEISDKIQKAEWPEAQSPKIINDLENGLKHIKRALGPVEKGGSDQLEFGDALRKSQIQIENSPQVMLREKADLRPAPSRRVTPYETVKMPLPATTESKQKTENVEETTSPKRGAVQAESISSSKEEIATTLKLTPEEKHEEVLGKIQANQEGWAKRVEARLQKEMENGKGSQETISSEAKESKNVQESQELKPQDEKTWAEKRLGHDENSAPDHVEINEAKENSQSEVEKMAPTKNGGEVNAPTQESTENGVVAPNEPEGKGDQGHETSPSDQPGDDGAKGQDKPKEDKGHETSPSDQPGDDGAKDQDKPKEDKGQGNVQSDTKLDHKGLESPTSNLPAENASQMEPSAGG